MEEEIKTSGTENQDGEKGGFGIEITDNLVILLLVVFTLIIGAWWFVNLYMGRWI